MEGQRSGLPGLPGLPKTTIPFLDPWIEDWPEPNHLFQGSQGQPPDFGEQLALPPPPPSPLPPPIPFPYPLPQPSPPPLFPPLPQEAPFFPGQPFPPHEFFSYNPTEDFSMPPHLGRCLCSILSHFPSLPLHLPQPCPASSPVPRQAKRSWITLVSLQDWVQLQLSLEQHL